MRALQRLERIERKRARKTTEYWIYYAEPDGDGHTARSSLTNEVRPVSELPADCHRIVITYDRK